MGRWIKQRFRVFPFDGFFVPFSSWSCHNWPDFLLATSVCFFPLMAVIPLYLLLAAWFSVSCKTNFLFCLSNCVCVCSRNELYERWKLHFNGEVYILLSCYLRLPLIKRVPLHPVNAHIIWKRLFFGYRFVILLEAGFAHASLVLYKTGGFLYTVIGLQRPCSIIPEYELT